MMYAFADFLKEIMILTIWLGVILVSLILYLKRVYSRFKDYGVSYFPPIPILGNAGPMMTGRRHVADDYSLLYGAFPDDRFTGRYDLLRPNIVIRDPDLIRQVTIKDFEHFLDHRPLIDDNVDPFFGRNLFSLRGQEWKDMRSTLSPAFTGSKMRGMVPFMVEVNKQMIETIKKKIGSNKDGYFDCEGKDLTTRYANDVIASCAFGVKVNSHTDEENQFYVMGRELGDFGIRKILIYLGYIMFPRIMKSFDAKFHSHELGNFFTNMVLKSMEDRDEKGIFRPDMIHLLMEAKKELDGQVHGPPYVKFGVHGQHFQVKPPFNLRLKVDVSRVVYDRLSALQAETETKCFSAESKLSYDEKGNKEADAGFATVEESDVGKKIINRAWSDIDLVAQATLFYVAGFETVSSAMTCALHELAVNPDIQDKLVHEIRSNEAKIGGKFDFSAIQDMTYMDMFVSEVLRKWPPIVGMDRLCVKDYNLGKANKHSTKDYIIRKGEGLTVPTWSIHHDPKYYPDPYKFDPERFSEENKRKIKPFSYMPFGSGPRNCVGSRFALCELKVMLYQLLQQIEVSPSEKTVIPATLAKDTFNVRLEGGHWVRFRLREEMDLLS